LEDFLSVMAATDQQTAYVLQVYGYWDMVATMDLYSQADLKVALRLNQRPPKTLGFETPASKLQASVASTG
jgi:hypothetical protein